MSSNQATIRHAAKEDVPAILGLIKDLAAYEDASSSVQATEDLLERTLSFTTPDSPESFTPGYAKTLLVVAPDGVICGMALYFYNFSTWTGVPGVYLEDLFVKPGYRRKGYGKLLIEACARETVRVGGKRLEWSCLNWNTPSLQFYENLGAKRKDEWVGLRVEGKELEEMAAEDERQAWSDFRDSPLFRQFWGLQDLASATNSSE